MVNSSFPTFLTIVFVLTAGHRLAFIGGAATPKIFAFIYEAEIAAFFLLV
jgi:hypothetical protein